MLILTRLPTQAIFIGDDIEVVVLSVNGNQVRIGIEAPRDIPVHREEIYRQIQRKDNNPVEDEGQYNSSPDDQRFNR